MTKTNIKKLMGLREKAREIAVTNPTQIALEVKQAFNEEFQKLKQDEDYIDGGANFKFRQEEKLRAKYRKQLFELLAEQKAEYKKVYDEATTLAKTLQTTPHAKPADELSVKLFEQELQSLKTSTLLGTNGGRSIDAVNAFIGKYGDEPYFASVIKDNFGQLSQNILSVESTVQTREALAKVLERVEMKATSDEQKAAIETLQAFGDGVPNFYRSGSPQVQAIANVVGGQHAAYLNEPEKWLETHSQAEQASE